MVTDINNDMDFREFEEIKQFLSDLLKLKNNSSDNVRESSRKMLASFGIPVKDIEDENGI